jgi:hypothetical protein
MDVSDINMRLRSLSWASSSGAKTGEAIRIFPPAGNESQVIGSFDRLAADAQRFEVVSQDGEVFVRPWLPSTSDVAIGSFGSVDKEEEQKLKAA